MGTLLSWIVTPKSLKTWDAEWLLGHFSYRPKTDTTWELEAPGGRIDVSFHRSEYASQLRPEWTAEIQRRLSGRLRRAKLESFVVMEYRGGPQPDHEAGWFEMIKVARLAAWEGNWPLLLCLLNPDHDQMTTFTAEETED